MNHRVLERTLRPMVFHGACLSERRFLLAQAELRTGYAFFEMERRGRSELNI